MCFFAIITFVSCSKKSDTRPNDNSVTINGTNYSVVAIGGQTWTSVNYNGEGGINYNNGSINNAADGKLYTIAEAQAIKLPKGWRLPTRDDFNKLLVSIGAVY
ncbi:MAG TPA: FISUMP domain-containing protein [Mucilaginibacter sp.]